MDSGNPNIERCLTLSVRQYRDILRHAEKLMSLVSTGSSAVLESHTRELNDLQSKAKQNDSRLLVQLVADPVPWKQQPLFVERQEVIGKVIEINKTMLPALQAAMAVAADDMHRLRAGRTRVVGYGSDKGKGSSIRSTV